MYMGISIKTSLTVFKLEAHEALMNILQLVKASWIPALQIIANLCFA
jgi:hypothetical protein